MTATRRITEEVEMTFADGGSLRLSREDTPPHRLRLTLAKRVIHLTDDEAKVLTHELLRHNRRSRAEAVSLGSIGGNARAAALTPQERREIAKRAALARWHPRDDRDPNG